MLPAAGRTAAGDAPDWPLSVRFADGDLVTLASPAVAGRELEEFDSEDDAEPAWVLDAKGRGVVLLVHAGAVLTCRLR